MTEGISTVGAYGVAQSLDLMKMQGNAAIKLIQSAVALQLQMEQLNNVQKIVSSEGSIDLYA